MKDGSCEQCPDCGKKKIREATEKEEFEKIEEGEESTLVLLNNMFFDFGQREEIENFAE